MNSELDGNLDSAREVERLIDDWDAALAAQDLDKMARNYAPDVLLYDVGDVVEGVPAWRAIWQKCFPYFGDSIAIERRHTRIVAGDDVACVYGYTRVSGPNTPPAVEQPWCRTTVCFERRDGEWRVVHEHASIGIDFEAGKPAPIVGEP